MSNDLKKDILKAKATRKENEGKTSSSPTEKVVDFGKPQRAFFEYKGEKGAFGIPKVFIAEDVSKKDGSSD